MARLPYLDRSDLLPEHQDLLARNLNLYRVLAHSPRAARSLNTLARYIRDGSRLDPRLRELAILQVGYLTRSAWISRTMSGSPARSASPTRKSGLSPRKPPGARPGSIRWQRRCCERHAR